MWNVFRGNVLMFSLITPITNIKIKTNYNYYNNEIQV